MAEVTVTSESRSFIKGLFSLLSALSPFTLPDKAAAMSGGRTSIHMGRSVWPGIQASCQQAPGEPFCTWTLSVQPSAMRAAS